MCNFATVLIGRKLEVIIVRGFMLSVPNSAASLLASPKICAILLELVSVVFLATKQNYLQTLNM